MSEHWIEVEARIEQEIEQTERRLVELKQARSAISVLARKQNGVAVPAESTPEKTRAKRSAPGQAKVSVRSRKPGRRAKHRGKLPATGAAFWLGILGDAQHTGREIVDAAMVALNLDDSARDAIYSRASNWFNGAVKKSLVQIVGERDGVNVYQRAG